MPGQYRKHAEIHVGENQFKCDLCDAHENTYMNLRYHKYEIHNIGLNPLDRIGVAQHITSKKRLKLHENEDTIYFSCIICGKKFRFQSFLKEHMRIHADTDNREFVCDICNCKFKRLAHLRIHFNAVHLKIKPFRCKECGNCYAQSGTLNEHMRVHTRARPYKCIVCSKDFRNNNYYKIHMREHTGETPYRCDHCNISFKNSRTLKGL